MIAPELLADGVFLYRITQPQYLLLTKANIPPGNEEGMKLLREIAEERKAMLESGSCTEFRIVVVDEARIAQGDLFSNVKFARFKNRTPDPGVCRIRMIDWERQKVDMVNGWCAYYADFSDLVEVDPNGWVQATLDVLDAKATPAKPFKLDFNLDDEEDLVKFLDRFEPARGRLLANHLRFKGKNSARAANGLMNYAQNKRAARTCRDNDNIPEALHYEHICDLIYKEDIQPFVECW